VKLLEIDRVTEHRERLLKVLFSKKVIYMSVQIFIENATNLNFTLFDTDNNNFGPVAAQTRYSLKLNYSDTFVKQYNLVFNGGKLSFWLTINGGLGIVNVYGLPYVFLIESQPRTRLPPFNKLIITPQNNTLARAPLVFTPYDPSDNILRNEFRVF
jgi:hypothetical protein